MFIIFGTRGIKHTVSDSEVLYNSCPNCNDGNLVNKLYRRWFTLFFIPVIPLDTMDRFYECDRCKSAYVENIKNLLQQSQGDIQENKARTRYSFASTVVACMTHMACIDNYLADEERREIMDFIEKFNDLKQDLLAIYEDIKVNLNKDNRVFNMLNESKKDLSSEGIMGIIAQAATVIEKEEEDLLKEYLIACGLPKSMYREVIDKLKTKDFSSMEGQLN